MTNNYYCTYQGVRQTDKNLATLVFQNVEFSSVADTLAGQIKWMTENTKNLNKIQAVNSLQYLWYNLHGISSSALWAKIESAINDEPEIKEW